MTTLDLPPTEQRSPLQRSRGDGIVRLAWRTQRGQGRRRRLVVAVIAAAVAFGVTATITVASSEVSRRENRMVDLLGSADLVVRTWGFTDGSWFRPLDAVQAAWLEEHTTPADEESVERLGPDLEEWGGGDRADDLTEDDLAPLLPPGSEVLRFTEAHVGPGWAVTDLDVTHALAGRTIDTGGRSSPLVGDEALASPALMAEVGAAVGDRVDVPGIGTVEVVGTATRTVARSLPLLVVAPGREPAAGPDEVLLRIGLPEGQAPDVLAADLWVGLRELVAGSAPDRRRSDLAVDVTTATTLGDGADDRVVATAGIVVTGFAVTIAGLLAACAFAVGVRRRLRELGVLGAVGATPAQLARLVRMEGLVLGALGALLGLGLGVGLAVLGRPVVEAVLGSPVTLRLTPFAILPPVLVGALGAMLAAWWPARTAARVPVGAALAGRIPAGRVPGWVPPASAALAAAGVALFAWSSSLNLGNTGYAGAELPAMLASVVATLGAAGLGLPILAFGGRIADRLPVPARVALRDAARRRSRSGAAVAALVPVLALPVVGIVLSSAHHVGEAGWAQPPPSPLVVVHGPNRGNLEPPPTEEDIAQVAAALPVDGRRAALPRLGLPGERGLGTYLTWRDPALERTMAAPTGEAVHVPHLALAVATPDVLQLVGLPEDAVADGEALVLARGVGHDPPADGQELAVADDPWLSVDPADTTALPPGPRVRARVVDGVDALPGGIALVTSSTAAQLGLREVGRPVVLGLERPVTWDEWSGASAWTGPWSSQVEALPVPRFTETVRGRVVLTSLAGLAALVVVTVVAGMTAALAATESDADLRRAVALGAPPSLRRVVHGIQAWWHTAIAAVLGSVLGGAVAVVGLDRVWQEPAAWVWPVVAVWALVAPVVVGVAVGLCMRPSSVEAPRRRTA